MAKLSMRVLSVGIVLALVFSAYLSSAEDRVSPVLHRRLQSEDWRLRRAAFFQLKQDKSEEARKELIDLLRREDAIARNGPDVEKTYGEAYLYYKDGELTEIVQQNFEQFHDKAALEVLLEGAYNPDSVFARWLGEQGPDVLPYTRRMLASDNYFSREKGIAVAAHLLSAAQSSKVSLSSDQAKQAHDQLVEATTHPDFNTRLAAVEYLGRVGGANDIPLLKRLSLSDPGFEKHSSSYPVRIAAVKALEKLQRGK